MIICRMLYGTSLHSGLLKVMLMLYRAPRCKYQLRLFADLNSCVMFVVLYYCAGYIIVDFCYCAERIVVNIVFMG